MCRDKTTGCTNGSAELWGLCYKKKLESQPCNRGEVSVRNPQDEFACVQKCNLNNECIGFPTHDFSFECKNKRCSPCANGARLVVMEDEDGVNVEVCPETKAGLLAQRTQDGG